MTARIDRLWPDPAGHITDEELVPRGETPAVRINFIASVDGAVTRDGRSGPLGTPADQRLFELLRRTSDVVLVGAGTVRTEGYDALRVSDASVQWRRSHGLPPHPVFAIVTAALDLDPESPVFTDAPVKPVLLTIDEADPGPFEGVADVVRAGPGRVDGRTATAALHARGLGQVLCEGGPTLFGSMLAADAVDELHLTVSPTLEGGTGPHIVAGHAVPRSMRLSRVLHSADSLLLRYRR